MMLVLCTFVFKDQTLVVGRARVQGLTTDHQLIQLIVARSACWASHQLAAKAEEDAVCVGLLERASRNSVIPELKGMSLTCKKFFDRGCPWLETALDATQMTRPVPVRLCLHCHVFSLSRKFLHGAFFNITGNMDHVSVQQAARQAHEIYNLNCCTGFGM